MPRSHAYYTIKTIFMYVQLWEQRVESQRTLDDRLAAMVRVESQRGSVMYGCCC